MPAIDCDIAPCKGPAQSIMVVVVVDDVLVVLVVVEVLVTTVVVVVGVPPVELVSGPSGTVSVYLIELALTT